MLEEIPREEAHDAEQSRCPRKRAQYKAKFSTKKIVKPMEVETQPEIPLDSGGEATAEETDKESRKRARMFPLNILQRGDAPNGGGSPSFKLLGTEDRCCIVVPSCGTMMCSLFWTLEPPWRAC